MMTFLNLGRRTSWETRLEPMVSVLSIVRVVIWSEKEEI